MIESKIYFDERRFIIFKEQSIEIGIDNAINPSNALIIISLNNISSIEVFKPKVNWWQSLIRGIWFIITFEQSIDPVKVNDGLIHFDFMDGAVRDIEVKLNLYEIEKHIRQIGFL